MASLSNIMVRPACVQDVREVVVIHQSAFPDFFLTHLGPDFLKLYYKSFISETDSTCLVAIHDGDIVGFSTTANKSRGFNTGLIKKHFLSFMLMGFKILFTNPQSIVRLVKNFSKREGGIEDDGNYAELYSIGVLSENQGVGIGKLLLKETEVRLREKEVKSLSLTTDYYNNEAAIGFYTKQGFDVLYEFETYPKRKMYRMIKML